MLKKLLSDNPPEEVSRPSASPPPHRSAPPPELSWPLEAAIGARLLLAAASWIAAAAIAAAAPIAALVVLLALIARPMVTLAVVVSVLAAIAAASPLLSLIGASQTAAAVSGFSAPAISALIGLAIAAAVMVVSLLIAPFLARVTELATLIVKGLSPILAAIGRWRLRLVPHTISYPERLHDTLSDIARHPVHGVRLRGYVCDGSIAAARHVIPTDIVTGTVVAVTAFFLVIPVSPAIALPAAVLAGTRAAGHWAAEAARLSKGERATLIQPHLAKTSDETYSRQILRVRETQKEPVIVLGRTTGEASLRGIDAAPLPDRSAVIEIESLRQHLLVLGGTGAGKTRLVIRPIIARYLDAVPSGGAMILDGKGTLWRDVDWRARQPQIVGHSGSVDLLAGLDPAGVQAVYRAVSDAVTGPSRDPYWPAAASHLIGTAATLAAALAFHRLTHREATAHPWSLVGITEIAVDLTRAASVLRENLSPSDLSYPPIAAAMVYAEQGWPATAPATRGSILGQVQTVLGPLLMSPLRKMASGHHDQPPIDITTALRGGCVAVAIGSATHGVAGQLVAAWIKTSFLRAARRQLARPAAERGTCLLVQDEWQALATTNGEDSDLAFWNVARETGVIGVFATQSVSALRLAVGDAACANLLPLARSRIVMRTDDPATHRWIEDLMPPALVPPHGTAAQVDATIAAMRAGAAGSVRAALASLFPAPLGPGISTPLTSHQRELAAEWVSADLGRHHEGGHALAMWQRAGVGLVDVIDLN